MQDAVVFLRQNEIAMHSELRRWIISQLLRSYWVRPWPPRGRYCLWWPIRGGPARKEYLFQVSGKWKGKVYKWVRGWTSGRSLPIQTFLESPPSLDHRNLFNWACSRRAQFIKYLRYFSGGIPSNSWWGCVVWLSKSWPKTLFQTNTYKANVRNYTPGFLVQKMNATSY